MIVDLSDNSITDSSKTRYLELLAELRSINALPVLRLLGVTEAELNKLTLKFDIGISLENGNVHIV
jgi:hypothetical protein